MPFCSVLFLLFLFFLTRLCAALAPSTSPITICFCFAPILETWRDSVLFFVFVSRRFFLRGWNQIMLLVLLSTIYGIDATTHVMFHFGHFCTFFFIFHFCFCVRPLKERSQMVLMFELSTVIGTTVFMPHTAERVSFFSSGDGAGWMALSSVSLPFFFSFLRSLEAGCVGKQTREFSRLAEGGRGKGGRADKPAGAWHGRAWLLFFCHGQIIHNILSIMFYYFVIFAFTVPKCAA